MEQQNSFPGLKFNTTYRALSWAQPFGSLMLHCKIETRNRQTHVRGPVIIATTLQPYSFDKIISISGRSQKDRMDSILSMQKEPTRNLFGYAIAVGMLVDCYPMRPQDEDRCFVLYREGLWCWEFKEVRRIVPVPWVGKQGWCIVDDEVVKALQYI